MQIAFEIRKKMSCYLATNQEQERAKYLMHNLAFENSFDGIFAAYELGHANRQSKFFKKIEDRLQNIYGSELRSVDIFFVDDAHKKVPRMHSNPPTRIKASFKRIYSMGECRNIARSKTI